MSNLPATSNANLDLFHFCCAGWRRWNILQYSKKTGQVEVSFLESIWALRLYTLHHFTKILDSWPLTILPRLTGMEDTRILPSPLLHMELLFRHSTMIISQTTGRPGGLGDAERNWIESRDLFIWVSLCKLKNHGIDDAWMNTKKMYMILTMLWYNFNIVVYNWKSQYQPGDDLFMFPVIVTDGNLRHAFPIFKEVHGTVQYSN